MISTYIPPMGKNTPRHILMGMVDAELASLFGHARAAVEMRTDHPDELLIYPRVRRFQPMVDRGLLRGDQPPEEPLQYGIMSVPILEGMVADGRWDDLRTYVSVVGNSAGISKRSTRLVRTLSSEDKFKDDAVDADW